MTLYGYARVSVREPEDKNLDLQVERLVRAGCSLGNIRAEEASGARNDRGGLLELLDLVVEGEPFGSVSDWLQEDAMVGLKVAVGKTCSELGGFDPKVVGLASAGPDGNRDNGAGHRYVFIFCIVNPFSWPGHESAPAD